MKQARAVLRLIPCDGPANTGDSDGPETSARQEGPRQGKGDAARGARQDLLKEWMGSHTRILGLWLDRLLEEGDDAELVSMIHRQHAWLSMMQARMERG